MFGLETEAIITILSAVGGWFMRQQTNNQQLLKDQMEFRMNEASLNNENQNAAAERNKGKASFLQRFAGVTIIGTIMFGLFLFAFFGNIETAVEYTKPTRNWLFGLFQTGGNTELLTSTGFFIPSFVKQSFFAIVGFLFGSSVGKIR